MGCHCAEGWICKTHPNRPAHHDRCSGRSTRCHNRDCPWWRGPLPAAFGASTWANVISLDATPEATILDTEIADDGDRSVPDIVAPLDSPLTRDCTDCGLRGGMARQNLGLFTAYYLCSRCGTHLTIPPLNPPRGI
jgi:hypothetical protein